MVCFYGCGREATVFVGEKKNPCCTPRFFDCPEFRKRVRLSTQKTWDSKQGATKVCGRCRTEKSVEDDFYKNQNGRPSSRCKLCVRAVFEDWAAAHPEENKESRRQAQKTPSARAGKRRYEYGMRVAVLAKLGNKCARCGWTDPRALHIDHVHGKGAEEKRQRSVLYRQVLADTEGKYQLLCANHNAIKKYENLEGVSRYHPLASQLLSASTDA